MAQQWEEQWASAEGYPGGFAAWIAAVPLTPEQLKRAHKWLIAVAMLALISGLVSIAVPIITSVTMAILIGWVLLFAGITTVGHAVSDHAPLRALEAIVTIVAGLYLLIFPLNGTVTLTFVLAIWFFAGGVFSLIAALQNRGAPESGMALFGGVLSLLLGVLIAVELPSSAAWAIGLLVGIDLIFWSVRALIGARILKQGLLSP